MAPMVLDSDIRVVLIDKAEQVEDLVERGTDEQAATSETTQDRARRREDWYHKVEDAVLDLVNVLPAGTENYEALQLFRFLTELRRAIGADPEVVDPRGAVELAAMKMGDVVRRMARELEHARLEDARQAFEYVDRHLAGLSLAELARVFGTTPKTVSAWRSGTPIERKTDRVKLIAQLVAYLHRSFTPTGLLMWLENSNELLDGSTPLELMANGVATAWAPLVAYARGGRGQLAG